MIEWEKFEPKRSFDGFTLATGYSTYFPRVVIGEWEVVDIFYSAKDNCIGIKEGSTLKIGGSQQITLVSFARRYNLKDGSKWKYWKTENGIKIYKNEA